MAFGVIFAGILVYSAVYSPDRGNHPLPSAYRLVTGEKTISTGLSRSFSALVRLRFDDAREFNPYGPRIFLFFATELLLRIIVLFIMLRGKIQTERELSIRGKMQTGNKLQVKDRMQTNNKLWPVRWLILSDAAQSLFLFVICFRPFLAYWMHLL